MMRPSRTEHVWLDFLFATPEKSTCLTPREYCFCLIRVLFWGHKSTLSGRYILGYVFGCIFCHFVGTEEGQPYASIFRSDVLIFAEFFVTLKPNYAKQ